VPSPADDARPQLPAGLERLDDLRIDVGRRRQLPLARCRVVFDFCSKPVPVGTDPAWTATPQVLLEGRALFPEIALLALFRKAGWKGVWFDPVHRRTYDKMPNVSKGVGLDTRVTSTLAKVNAAAAAARRASCWDLVLWDGRTVLFVDVSPGPAAPGHARIAWLDAALRTGLSPGQFLVVAWETRRVAARKRPARTAPPVA
jgi:hypothetical protein